MFEFCINDHKYSLIHFIGIGGISMSGLAEILVTEGYNISGSDTKPSQIIERLKKLNIQVFLGHKKTNVQKADLVIYTDAISEDNEEYLEALKLGIPVVDRATFLGALMKNYKNSIAVSGTHGKTTTTSILSTILTKSTPDPTILLGGQLDSIGGNVKLGNKDLILTEACEYKANILKYYPTMAIILNIDEDHLDYFKDMNHILDTFIGYGKNLSETSYLIINKDDVNSHKVIENTKANIVTFGINEDSDYKAEDIKFSSEGYPSFMVKIKGENIYPIQLNVMGIHNIYNALGSIAAAHTYGISMSTIQEHISSYSGVHRRLELKGYFDGVKVIDDYAHHPTEIKAALEALKNSTQGNIYCIFQPHTFTRTQLLLNSFAESFAQADNVIIADIYAAREKDLGAIHSKDLTKAIANKGSKVVYLPSFKEIEEFIIQHAKPGDIVVTMGAGNVYLVGESIIETSKEKAAV